MKVQQIVENILNKSATLQDFELSLEQAIEVENLLKTLKKEANSPEKSKEVVKFDNKGQWTIEKTNFINYKNLNSQKASQERHDANAHTIDYSSGQPKIKKPKMATPIKARITSH